MMIPLTPLEWDSNFFGLKTGRVSGAGAADIRQVLQKAREEEYQLIYAYSETPLSTALLYEFNGLDVGGQVTFSKTIGEPPAPAASDHVVLRYEEEEPTQAMIELALLSGHLSRFFTDTRLPAGSYERMYERWLRNSLEGGRSNAVFVSGNPVEMTGLITASWDAKQCSIGLLAVSRSAQGRGIGSSLLRSVELESIERKIEEINVRTQTINGPACKLYRNNKYGPTKESYLYHLHLDTNAQANTEHSIARCE